jgi:hypothetical protein
MSGKVQSIHLALSSILVAGGGVWSFHVTGNTEVGMAVAGLLAVLMLIIYLLMLYTGPKPTRKRDCYCKSEEC